ncbi:MAG: RNase P subunit p30 family protein [Candidatus Micrarchaeia archaeon]
MFDIIACTAEPSDFGFSRFYSLDEAKGKIATAENLEGALAHKNRKVLVSLRDFAFDEGAIKVIAEKKSVCFILDIGRLVRTRGVPRAIAISKLRNFLRLCVKHGAYYTFASFAESPSQIRRPGELESIALLFGLNRGQAKMALKMLQHYL